MFTYFIDLDGTVLHHYGRGASIQWSTCDVLPQWREWFDNAERDHAYIVLTTARKESCRPDLERMLREVGLYWDVLLMGLPHGMRVLINDIKADGSRSALAINVERNTPCSL